MLKIYESRKYLTGYKSSTWEGFALLLFLRWGGTGMHADSAVVYGKNTHWKRHDLVCLTPNP